VDTRVFHARGRVERSPDEPVTVFVYARPGHFRNCWEIASIALEEFKQRFSDRVRIVTAGSWASTNDVGSGVEHLGLLDYAETGELYRRCDIGVALTVSEHPSYLPLELMACGVPVVAFDNPAGYWLLRDEYNSLLVHQSATAIEEAIGRLVVDVDLRAELRQGGLKTIAAHHSSWDAALSDVYAFVSHPSGNSASEMAAPLGDPSV
jgi:glycosyltransferase involved in cell wall biosynthesis